MPAACTPPSNSARRGVARWVVLALLLQAVAMAQHRVAVAAGIEVCGAGGSMRVDRHGNPVTDASVHACCCPSAAAPPPVAPAGPAEAHPHEVPGAADAAAGPGGVWLAPLSRGPPAP